MYYIIINIYLLDMCIFTIYISEIIYIIIYIMFVYLKDSSIIYDIYIYICEYQMNIYIYYFAYGDMIGL